MKLSRRAAVQAPAVLALAACVRRAGVGAASAATPESPLKAAAPFPVGTCVMTLELMDAQFVDLTLRHFNQVTPEFEMKMERVLADDGSYRLDAADAIAAFCRRHSLYLHGTTLAWYAEDPPFFRRLAGDRKAFEDHWRAYLLKVVGRYRGLARGWDVLNEAVAENGDGYRGGVWADALGPDYGRFAFETAREADPDAVLFLNDYNLEILPAKLDAFQRLLERLLKAGTPVDGIGTQSHLTADIPPGEAGRAIRALARFGLPIHVSELDVSTRHSSPSLGADTARLQRQARLFAEVADAFMALPRAQRYAFTVWGVRDKDSWLRRPPNESLERDQPLLFDDAGKPKPAFDAVRDAFSVKAA